MKAHESDSSGRDVASDGGDASGAASARAADMSSLDVLHVFESAGWSANHLVEPDARMRCGRCGMIVDAHEVVVEARHRVEGASDPADMQEVLGAPCPRCAAKGALVLSYGPQGSEDDQQFLRAIDTSHAADPLGER